MERDLSELFAEIVSWASEVKGAENVGAQGKLWCEVTEPSEFFDAPVTVKINATKEDLDGVPPFSAVLTNDRYFPGIMAIANPYGGAMIGAGPGDEDRLINHFKAQVRPEPVAA